jgi:predicted acylesterase/phospholipase RssA
LGAVKFLLEAGERPTIISCASGGSILGVLLAQGDTDLTSLESLFTGLRRGNDVYSPQPWLADAAEETRELAEDIARDVSVGRLFLTVTVLPPLLLVLEGIELAIDAAQLTSAVERGLRSPSAFTLEPLRGLLRRTLDPGKIDRSGIKLRIAVVSLESSEIRFVTERGTFADAPVPPPEPAECVTIRASLADFEPRVSELRDERDGLDIRRAGDRERIFQINDELSDIEQEMRRLTARASELGCNVGEQRIDLIDAVLASAAMPGIFPPVALGGELYVDGGIRALVPVRAAVEAGADRIFVIYPKLGTVREPSFARSNMIEIGLRSVDIMLDENRRSEMRAGGDATMVVIQPSFEVHSELTFEPGFTAISISYGNMRAFDAVRGAGTAAHADFLQLSDAITRLRLRIWSVEHQANGVRLTEPPPLIDISARRRPEIVPVADPDALRAVRVMKWLVRQLARRRQELGGNVPADATGWWLGWEAHSWTPTITTPWDLLISRAGIVDAVSFDAFTAEGEQLREDSAGVTFVIRAGRKAAVAPAGRVAVVPDGTLRWLDDAPPLGPEPAECGPIRADLAELNGSLLPLFASKEGLDFRDPQDRADIEAINAQIAAIDQQITDTRARGTALGCSL